MYVTTEGVKRLTGYTVSAADVIKAQAILDVFVGRTEDEVADSRDKGILQRATAFQAAYMQSNPEIAYEQIGLRQMGQNESIAIFDTFRNAPFLAPLANAALGSLSFRRSRSVKTGSTFGRGLLRSWWTD